MFIHYNMATYQGVQWVEGYPSPADFNPGGKVDTDAWADAAKSAGRTGPSGSCPGACHRVIASRAQPGWAGY